MAMLGDLTEANVATIIRRFYELAANDFIIGHFFFNKDLEHIVAQQTRFAIGLLGGQGGYQGKSLPEAHRGLGIRPPHFGRRQVLMKQVLVEHGLPEAIWMEWLRREERLRQLVMGD